MQQRTDHHICMLHVIWYASDMKNNTILRIGAGAAFVALGGILLSESFGVQFHYWREFWYGLCALGFMTVGVLTLRNRNWLWGALWMVIGLAIGAHAFFAYQREYLADALAAGADHNWPSDYF